MTYDDAYKRGQHTARHRVRAPTTGSATFSSSPFLRHTCLPCLSMPSHGHQKNAMLVQRTEGDFSGILWLGAPEAWHTGTTTSSGRGSSASDSALCMGVSSLLKGPVTFSFMGFIP